jgi:hypothetical protein
MTTRPIRQEEIELVSHLLQQTKDKSRAVSIPTLVSDLLDGGMGSIRFVNEGERIFGTELIEARYHDQDGVEVSISINLDNNQDLFELDFWKVDFSRLIQYPKPEQLEM